MTATERSDRTTDKSNAVIEMPENVDLEELRTMLDELEREVRDRGPRGRAIARTAERLKAELPNDDEILHDPEHLTRFKHDYLKITGDSRDAVPKGEVYDAYICWADKNDVNPVTQRKLSRELQQRDPRIDRKEQGGTRYYTGVELDV